ncbi:MAG: hypothetical protein ABUK01_16260 [Leptospirales bacterium]
MTPIKEIAESVKDRIVERVSDPFLGSFVMFYFAVYWQRRAAAWLIAD